MGMTQLTLIHKKHAHRLVLGTIRKQHAANQLRYLKVTRHIYEKRMEIVGGYDHKYSSLNFNGNICNRFENTHVYRNLD